MKGIEALKHLERIVRLAGSRRNEMELVVPVYQPGSIGPHPSVPVTGIQAGIDWDARTVLVKTETEVSTLSAAEREAILHSAQQGQSWYAYRREQKLRDRIQELEARLAALESSQASGSGT